MKSNNNTCCGTVGPQRKLIIDVLPDNPKIVNGVEIIYLGSGKAKIKGSSTGLYYYASDHQRSLKVSPTDLNSLLSKKLFMLKPR